MGVTNYFLSGMILQVTWAPGSLGFVGDEHLIT